VVLAVVVVVTHFGLLLVDSEAGRLDGLLGDLDRLLEGGTAGRGNVDGLVENGVIVSGGDSYLFVVDGAETLAVLTLSDVDGAAVGLRAGTVDLDVGVVVFCVSAGAVFFANVLLCDARTAVTFFHASCRDLFFAEAAAARELGGGGERRRVLTFPSGGWFGEPDFDLLVGGRLGVGLGRSLAVGRREDAEGDGDASLKVQIGDLLRGKLQRTRTSSRSRWNKKTSMTSRLLPEKQKIGVW
jgi:hypothetical protein